MTQLDQPGPDAVAVVAAVRGRSPQLLIPRRVGLVVAPWPELRLRGELLALRVLRGELGREYLLRSLDTLDRFWRCPGTYGIRPGKYGLFTTDATSGKGIPQSSTEWTNAGFSGVVAPTSLYLFQEASGNFADSIGAFTLTASNVSTYAQAVTGWSTKGWNVAADATARNALTTSASLPDLSTTSMAALIYCKVNTAPSANKDIMQFDTSANSRLRINSTPRFVCVDGANTATGTVDPTGAVRLYFLKYDKTNSAQVGYNEQSKLTPTFAAGTGKKFLVGGSSTGNLPPDSNYLYGARWDGTNANISDADVANMITQLLWTRSWAAAMVVSLSESESLSESITALVQVTVALSETDNLSESMTAQVSETVALAESLTESESMTAQVSETVALAESLAESEAMSALMAATTSLAESLSESEALAIQVTMAAPLAESLSESEALAIQVTMAAPLAESLALAESLLARMASQVPLADAWALTEAIRALAAGDLAGALAAVRALAGALGASRALDGKLSRPA